MTIAVDFDGTIVTDRYPGIGNEIPFAVETLKLLQQEHHRLILWSVREGKLLDEAVAWCKERGVEFYAVNKEYPEQNVGVLLDWGIVYRMIKEHKTYRDIYASGDDVLKKKKRGWF